MEELYEFVYGKIDPPIYYPKLKIGKINVGDILDWNTISLDLRPDIASLKINEILPERITGTKKITTVYTSVINRDT